MAAANRETWLYSLADLMAPRFQEIGFPIPKFRVAIGWPSAGKDAPVTGECWDKRVSGDAHFEIFLNPGRDDAMAVACTFAHELVHASVGLEHGHKGDFATAALALGFKRPLTTAQQPETLKVWLAPLLAQVGPIPHAAITYSRGGPVRVKGTAAGIVPDEPANDDAPVNTRPPKQSTRLMKCECRECGYTVRVTRKWLEVGPPHCPHHGAMDTPDEMPD